jgi:hypothetical protein
MSFNITYKTLFAVTILHGYFLNSGKVEYNSMNSDKKKKALKNYDLENFFEILPSRETLLLLKNNHLVFRVTKSEIRIEVKTTTEDPITPFVNLSLLLTMTFIIKIKDSFFENYTNINLLPNRIIYLSNVKPAEEPITFKYIPLLANAIFIDDSYIISEVSSAKIIEPLEDFEKRGIIGVISLKMQGDKPNLKILTNQKKIITPAPNFKIHLNNRKTFWKYTKTNTVFEVETSLAKPLTQNGFVEIDPLTDFTTNPTEASDYQYPNPSIRSIQKIGPKIYSQIFI